MRSYLKRLFIFFHMHTKNVLFSITVELAIDQSSHYDRGSQITALSDYLHYISPSYSTLPLRFLVECDFRMRYCRKIKYFKQCMARRPVSPKRVLLLKCFDASHKREINRICLALSSHLHPHHARSPSPLQYDMTYSYPS